MPQRGHELHRISEHAGDSPRQALLHAPRQLVIRSVAEPARSVPPSGGNLLRVGVSCAQATKTKVAPRALPDGILRKVTNVEAANNSGRAGQPRPRSNRRRAHPPVGMLRHDLLRGCPATAEMRRIDLVDGHASARLPLYARVETYGLLVETQRIEALQSTSSFTRSSCLRVTKSRAEIACGLLRPSSANPSQSHTLETPLAAQTTSGKVSRLGKSDPWEPYLTFKDRRISTARVSVGGCLIFGNCSDSNGWSPAGRLAGGGLAQETGERG